MLEDNGIMKQSQFILTSLLLLVSSFAWSAKPIHNIVDESVPMMADGSSATLEDVKKAIITGCERKGWNATLDGDAQIKCSILVRGKHYAEVTIPYSESSYSILYSDSRVLDYNEKKQRIHRNYNGWVINLSETINQQFNSIGY
jgi:hypothetical protein